MLVLRGKSLDSRDGLRPYDEERAKDLGAIGE